MIKMYLGLKIRIYPNSVQKKIIDEHIEGARYVYNYFLKYAKDNKIYDDTIWKKKLYTMMKNDNNDLLNNCDYFLLLTQLDVLKTSYDRFFRGTIKNEPYFKKKGALVSAFKIHNKNDSIKIEDNKIYIKMLGYMKFRNKKDISKNKIYSAIVKKTLDDIYEVSILYENTIAPIEKAYQKVGIDLGVRKFITTSDSNYYL
ncbi:MAG: helix-turn-helix domain-containing protein, partial [bacterium]|nr:helix-turn-helix domain-containing protein [bacterium]